MHVFLNIIFHHDQNKKGLIIRSVCKAFCCLFQMPFLGDSSYLIFINYIIQENEVPFFNAVHSSACFWSNKINFQDHFTKEQTFES